ncbi:MAG TPA: hypothetical protein GX499_02400 [Clostridiales bacterium]|nr:hypothetical protein [Clostridiales bacterium]
MQLLLTNSSGTFDITNMVPSVQWSGDYQQIARTLSVGILSSATDKTIPTVDCSLGCTVQLVVGGEVLFDGKIRSRTMSTEGSTIDVVCYDRGFVLKRTKVLKTYTNKKPTEIVRDLAGLYNIPLGKIADPDVRITRNFVTGRDSIMDVIQTAYTLASQTTKKAYHIGFRGRKLYITVKEPDQRTLILRGGSNLISATTTESVENMVNAVQIYDVNGKFLREIADQEAIKLHDRLQEIVKQTKNDNKAAEAQKLLDNGGVTQKITVHCLGNVANVTGGTVVVQEPYTGLYGLFYIDSDVHEWKRGQYYNKLTLNFKAIMDEKEAGSLPNATGSKTGGNGASDKIIFEHGYGWDTDD